MSLDLLVELVALLLAVWIAWRFIPRVPGRDLHQLFKVTLATRIRGEVEAADGSFDAWRARALGPLAYHPMGRQVIDKLWRPDPGGMRVPALEGELGLVEALAGLPDVASRWRRMFVDDAQAEDGLLGDPALLGPEVDPGQTLSTSLDWEDVAQWSTALKAALGRQLAHTKIVAIDGVLEEALSQAVPELRVEGCPASADMAEALAALVEQPADRLILISEGEGSWHTLKALTGHAGLRDRLAAAVFLGGAFGGEDRTAWLAEAFTHEAMDTELNRATPYVCVGWVGADLAAADPDALAAQFLVEPTVPSSGRRSIRVVDLGLLQRDAVSTEHVGEALMLTLAHTL
jgi:hypothetical protein